MAGYGTLVEVQEKWNICDLADAHEAMELKSQAEEYYLKQAKENARRD